MIIFPIAAMVIVGQYNNIDEFLDHALLGLHETGEVTLSMDGTFSVEYVGEGKEEDDEEQFFIYTPFLDFIDLTEKDPEPINKPRRGRPRKSV